MIKANPKPRTCLCGETFTPWTTTQKVCSPACALIKVQQAKDKKRRKENREAKARLKTRGDWLREAQIAFNAYIRARDNGDGCISCGRNTGCKMNAGHYRSVGACPELRFEEFNVHLQCEHCNSYLSGNAIEYRIRLIDKIGQEKVAWLEGPHDHKKYSIDDIKAIKAEYRKKRKELNEIA